MDPLFTIFALMVILSPVISGGLRRGKPLSIVVLVMFAYGVASIHFARTETGSEQYFLLAAAIISFVGARYFVIVPNRGGSLITGRESRPKFNIRPKKRRLWLVACTGFIFSAFLFVTHGIPLLSGNSMSSRLDILSNGYLGTLAVAPLNVALIAILISIEFKRDGLKRSIIKLIGALLVFATLWLYANRGMAIFPFLTVGAFYFMKYPKYILHVFILSVATIFLVGYAGYKRNFEAWGIAYDIDLASRGFEGIGKYLAPVVDYIVGTSQALNIILHSIPDHVPHPMGRIFFSALASPLPGPQPTAGAFLKDIAGVDFEGGGLAMGSIGGLYIDFGILGVIVGFVVAGLIIGFLELKSLQNPKWSVAAAWFTGHLILMNYAHPLPNLATILIPFILFWVMGEREEGAIHDQAKHSHEYSE